MAEVTTCSLSMEEKALLSEGVEEVNDMEVPRSRPASLHSLFSMSCLLFFSATCNLILIVLLAGTFSSAWTAKDELDGSQREGIYSPANTAIEYHTVLMNTSLDQHNRFSGVEPTSVQSEAWDEMLNWQILSVSEADLKAIGRHSETSVKFTDGSGYLAELDVYHQLHCLNYIRKYIHREYYPEGESPKTQAIHVSHCIESLRQIILCHADTSLVTFDWNERELFPYPNFVIERQCRNWDRLLDYSKAHQPGTYEGALVHPILGPVPLTGP